MASDRFSTSEYDSIVIGGGFFGVSIALVLAEKGQRVLILERGRELLGRASYNNQARVHAGYHYPRHFLTALRSRVNFPRFVQDFESCIVQDFEHYYAIAKRFSKTTASQFHQFMNRVGAPIERAPENIRQLFDPHLIEEVFSVQEQVFDADRLRAHLKAALQKTSIEIQLQAEVRKIDKSPLEAQVLDIESQSTKAVRARRIFNCTYSGINTVLTASAVAPIPLKHEITEMCLIDVPDAFRKRCVTVMCGPFFSLMPFPSRGLHTLSHVRYTPHATWQDQASENLIQPYALLNAFPKVSHFPQMIRDATRYLPLLKDSKYKDSLWEVKTILPQSDDNDGRPILFQNIPEIPGLTCIMGGKIDNIYDVFEAIS